MTPNWKAVWCSPSIKVQCTLKVLMQSVVRLFFLQTCFLWLIDDLSLFHSIHTDFVSWRGHFTKIFCTPYESREPWQLAATRYQGTIYISEVETAEAREKRKNISPKQDEMCYWGLKFEDYVTTPVDARLISQEGAVNQNEAFITIIRSRMNRHSIVLGAEVDCCKKVCDIFPQSLGF